MAPQQERDTDHVEFTEATGGEAGAGGGVRRDLAMVRLLRILGRLGGCGGVRARVEFRRGALGW